MLKGLSETHISQHAETIATFALCGFANLSSIAIQVGGIGEIAPSRRGDLARLGVKALICGPWQVICRNPGRVAGLVTRSGKCRKLRKQRPSGYSKPEEKSKLPGIFSKLMWFCVSLIAAFSLERSPFREASTSMQSGW